MLQNSYHLFLFSPVSLLIRNCVLWTVFALCGLQGNVYVSGLQFFTLLTKWFLKGRKGDSKWHRYTFDLKFQLVEDFVFLFDELLGFSVRFFFCFLSFYIFQKICFICFFIMFNIYLSPQWFHCDAFYRHKKTVMHYVLVDKNNS